MAVAFPVVGLNGSGLMLVDQAYDQPVRGFVAAFFGGLRATGTVLGALILLGLGFAAVMLVVYLLSFFARIPGIGGFFAFVLAGPSVAMTVLIRTVLLLAGPLVIIAIWAASSYQGFLRHHRKCGQDADLDRGIGLRARRHRQKAAQPLGEPLGDATDPEPDTIRENPIGSAT